MNNAIGFSDTTPLIKAVYFPQGKIVLQLMDGRSVNLPINKFPEIEKLTPSQKRRHKTLAGMGLMFDDCETVFHISDFLGKPFSVDASPLLEKRGKKYSSKRTTVRYFAEPKVKYKRK